MSAFILYAFYDAQKLEQFSTDLYVGMPSLLFVVLYKCIPADDIIMMILCISPLSSQYCPSLTHVSLYWISHITFPHDLILQNSANILHHRLVTARRGEWPQWPIQTNQPPPSPLTLTNLQTFINCLDNPPKICALFTLKYHHSDKFGKYHHQRSNKAL